MTSRRILLAGIIVVCVLAGVVLALNWAPGPAPAPTPTTPAPTRAQAPDSNTTGVRPAVTLDPAESITVSEDGAVIEGLHVRGRITIAANDVVIRDTLVQTDTSLYPIMVESGVTGALIEWVEVDNLNGTGIGIFFSGSGTVRHSNIHSANDGVRIQADDVTVAYSYIHDLARQVDGHHDSIQIRRGDNVTLIGNNLQAYKASTGDPMNAALQVGSLLDKPITNLRVIDNLMNGGNYTINGGGSAVVSAYYSGNRFGRDFRYGIAASLGASVWDDTNVWEDTGQPVR